VNTARGGDSRYGDWMCVLVIGSWVIGNSFE
jgi:hypothetical protein